MQGPRQKIGYWHSRVFTCRHVVIDHATDDVFLVALHEQHQSAVDQADDWLQKTAAQLRLLRNQAQMPDKSQALRFKQRTDPERSSRPGASPARPLKKLASGKPSSIAYTYSSL